MEEMQALAKTVKKLERKKNESFTFTTQGIAKQAAFIQEVEE